MKIKIDKITKMLLLVSVAAVIFDLVRVILFGQTNLYLILNLFLAWIPYIISYFFIKKEMSVVSFIPFFILWLLFFPNAPYVATDVWHLAGIPLSFLWYDGLLYFFFGWVGLFLACVSLFQIDLYFKARFSRLISELIIFAICFISSFGIYLGKFFRWNSWDIFFRPVPLVKNSLDISANLVHTGAPMLFVGVFGIFLYIIYKTLSILLPAGA